MQEQFAGLVALIQQSRTNALKAVNAELVNLYWNVGAFISKQLSEVVWGEGTVDELAQYIMDHHPEWKGFGRRGLYRMKLFYETYNGDQFVTTLLSQIQSTDYQEVIVSSPMSQLQTVDIRKSLLCKVTWTHHITLISRTNSEWNMP